MIVFDWNFINGLIFLNLICLLINLDYILSYFVISLFSYGKPISRRLNTKPSNQKYLHLCTTDVLLTKKIFIFKVCWRCSQIT